MYAAERQQRILELARGAGRVEVTTLAEDLGVATETVRRDLNALEQRGSLRRVHGGAIPVERLEAEPTLEIRSGRLSETKRRIAARVLDYIPAGGTLLLDSGSTALAVVELLPANQGLTVVTNSVPAAALLSARDDIELFLLGGRVRGVTGAAVGEWTTAALADLVVDVAVLGTNGMSAARGFTTPDQSEARVKTAMAAAARKVIVAADSSKAGDDYFQKFAALEDAHVIITDAGLPDDVAQELREAGPEVVTA